MSRIRVRAGWPIAIGCLFFVFLALALASPAPVKAYWNPKIVSAPPKDPGTPFEEPEGGGDPTDHGAGPSTRPGTQPPATGSVSPDQAQGAAVTTLQQVVLRTLVLILMHP
jgi:hypothetical protein